MRFLLLLMFVSAAHADEWKAVDYTLLGAATALLVVDWGQTRSITSETVAADTIGHLNEQTAVQRQRAYHEKNPLLGENPSKGEVDTYFALAILGTAGLAYVLPQTYRRWFLGGVFVLETAVVLRNHRLGLRVEF